MPIKHKKEATAPDQPGAEINKAEWNDDHTNPDIADVTGLQAALDNKYSPENPPPGGGAVDSVNGQTGDVVLTKSDVGLASVDNTSDAAKPISTATQTALNAKVNGTTRITVGTTAPASPAVGDIWVDTN